MTRRRRRRPLAPALAAAMTLLGLAGCGFDVASPDVFLITRTGNGPTRTLLVNNAGYAKCDGGNQRTISSAQLIAARDLSDNLQMAAQKSLTIARTPQSIYEYTIAMQQGTIRFPDTGGRGHTNLAKAELYFVQTLQSLCGISA